MALRIALIALLAAALLAGLRLAIAQAPNCTTPACVYLPLMVKPFPMEQPTAVVATNTPAPTAPTLAPFVTDTPVVATATPWPTSAPQPTALP